MTLGVHSCARPTRIASDWCDCQVGGDSLDDTLVEYVPVRPEGQELPRTNPGTISNIRFFDRALTEEEIAGLYERGRADAVREIAAWLRHIDTLTKVRRVATILPGTNPLWDAGELLEREFASSEARSPDTPTEESEGTDG